MADAKLRLVLEGAEDLKRQLAEVQALLDQMNSARTGGVGPAPGGISGSPATAATTGSPPAPAMPAAGASAAAAGGPTATSLPANDLNVAQAAQGISMGQAFTLLAGNQAYQQALGLAGNAASDLAHAEAFGTTYNPGSMAGSLVQFGGASIAAGAAFLFGGGPAASGAAFVGANAALAPVKSYLDAKADAATADIELRDYTRAMGIPEFYFKGYPDEQQRVLDSLIRGRPTMRSFQDQARAGEWEYDPTLGFGRDDSKYDYRVGRGWLPIERRLRDARTEKERGPFNSAREEIAWSPEMRKLHGTPDEMSDASWDPRDVLSLGKSHPEAVATYLANVPSFRPWLPAFYAAADRHFSREQNRRVRAEDIARAQIDFEIARDAGDFGALESAGIRISDLMSSAANELRDDAKESDITETDRAVLEKQAEGKAAVAAVTRKRVRLEAIRGRRGLATQAERRALDRAGAGGYDAMIRQYQQMVQSSSDYAADLTAARMGPADDNAAAEALHNATYTLPMQMIQLQARQDAIDTGAKVNMVIAGGAYAQMYGGGGYQASAGSQAAAGAASLQADSLQRQANQLRPYDAMGASQLDNQAAALRTQATVLSHQAKLEGIQGDYATRGIGIYEQRSTAASALATGISGPAAAGAAFSAYQAAEKELSSAQRAYDETLATGAAPDSDVGRQRRAAIADAKMGLVNAQNALAGVPFGASETMQLSRLGVQADYIRAGYGGSRGALRRNLRSQMGLTDDYLADIDARERDMRAAGDLTPEQERILNAQRDGAYRQRLGMMQDYDSGWAERLFGRAYGMTMYGEMAGAGIRREAAIYGGLGDRSRNFGGTRTQMEEYRLSMPARMLRRLEGDSADATMNSAMGARVEVEVTVKDERGRPLEATQRVLRDAPTLNALAPKKTPASG